MLEVLTFLYYMSTLVRPRGVKLFIDNQWNMLGMSALMLARHQMCRKRYTRVCTVKSHAERMQNACWL